MHKFKKAVCDENTRLLGFLNPFLNTAISASGKCLIPVPLNSKIKFFSTLLQYMCYTVIQKQKRGGHVCQLQLLLDGKIRKKIGFKIVLSLKVLRFQNLCEIP